MFGDMASSTTYSVQPLSAKCFWDFLNKIILINFRGVNLDWGTWPPSLTEASLSLNDHISLTQPCYIQNVLEEAFVCKCAMFKIYWYLWVFLPAVLVWDKTELYIDKIGPPRHMTKLCSHLSLPPRIPATTNQKNKNKCHLIKKGQGWQLDYPSSNHLRCNTMWPPSPSLQHWNPSYAYELVLVGLVFATSQTTGRTITSFQDRDKFWVHLWDNNKELLVN